MPGFKKSQKYRTGRTKRSSHQKSKQKDKIKTVHDVRKAVQETAPSQAKLVTLSNSITTTPTILQSISEIQFNNDVPTQYKRASKKISVGSFRWKGNLVVGDATNLIRILVVRDKNQDDVAFDPQTCFFTDGNIIPQNVFAQINTRNVDVLWEHTYNLQDSTESTPGVRPSDVFMDVDVPIRKNLTYNSVAQDATVLPRNPHHYYMIAVSDSTVLPNPSIRANTVTWFKNLN